MNKKGEQQIKSKRRVEDHGEVFTSEREVNAMLDLVGQETERIESRFLEPACGHGNFLVEVLKKKLAVVQARYGKYPADYERYSVIAVSSIYGVDILRDNVDECRSRLFEIWDDEYTSVCKKSASDDCRDAVRFILGHNILWGDALTMKREDGSPIIFAEWSAVNGNFLKRRDFRLDQLLEGNTPNYQMSLFLDGTEPYAYQGEWEYDHEINAYIPLPVQEFPPIHYRRVQDHG